jgi:hypothetical protein
MKDLEWQYLQNSKNVLNYFKSQYGFVISNYAKKMLGVGDDKFKKIKEKYNLQEHKFRSPNSSFDMKLYDIRELQKIKEDLDKNKK